VILYLTGDPTLLLLPPDATAEEIARFRQAMGFNDPLAVQYLRFLRGAVQGNFGVSVRHGEPAFALVVERLPATMELALAALLVSLCLAIPAGIISAVRRRRRPCLTPDHLLWRLGRITSPDGMARVSHSGGAP
jgi:peptide/nickel transport system permease protein